MKNILVVGVAALALVGCGKKEEAVVEAAPAEATTPAPEAAVEAAPVAEVAPEAPAPESVDGGKVATP
jgi:hypothetical protein